MDKQRNLLSKTLVVGVIFLFIVTSVIPSVVGNNERLNNKDYTKVVENTKEQMYFFNNSPKVEIINPKNGSVVNNSSVNISVKFTDDNGIKYYYTIRGGYNYSGGGGGRLKEPKMCHFYNKTIFISPGYNLIFTTAYDEEGNVGYDFSLYYYNSNNSIPMNIPPKIEILTPENGSVVYDKNVRMCVKCTDDDGIVKFTYANCGAPGGGSGGTGFPEPLLEYYYNHTVRNVYTGYNWILAWAYDVNDNIGYDITMYRYDEMKNSFIIGFITDKEEMENYTTFKARALFYFDLKPFTFNYYRSGEEIIISNYYSGYVGLCFITGRFNASLIIPCTPTSIQHLSNGIKRGT